MPHRDPDERVGTETSSDRHDDSRIVGYLDSLDARDPDLRNPSSKDRRWPYRRHALRLTIEGETGPRSALRVFTRAVNEKRLWMLSAHFLYPGSYGSLTLLTSHNMWHTVHGVVTHCRYIGDGVHEITLLFDQAIELGAFVPEAIKRSVLIVDDEQMSRNLLAVLFNKLHVTVQSAGDCANALKAARDEHFDLVLLDLSMPEPDGYETLDRLRRMGYHGPVIALTALPAAEHEDRCIEHGFDGFMAKPVTYDKLSSLMMSLAQEPMFSSHADDELMRPLITEFVTSLPDTTRSIDAAVMGRDWPTLRALVRSLKADAGGLGFDTLADKTDQLERLLAAPDEVEQVAKLAQEVVFLCRLARSTSKE